MDVFILVVELAQSDLKPLLAIGYYIEGPLIDSIQRLYHLLQSLLVHPIVLLDVVESVLYRHYPVRLVLDCAVYTVHAQEFLLILAVECDEIVVEHTSLRNCVLEEELVNIKTGAKVLSVLLQLLYKGVDLVPFETSE